ncbi:hypothetical protein ACFE04_031339 [Oxalis oulophora]
MSCISAFAQNGRDLYVVFTDILLLVMRKHGGIIAAFVFGRTVICRDMDVATRVARNDGLDVAKRLARMWTLNGWEHRLFGPFPQAGKEIYSVLSPTVIKTLVQDCDEPSIDLDVTWLWPHFCHANCCLLDHFVKEELEKMCDPFTSKNAK